MTFAELKLNPQLLRAVESLGYTQPTQIQEKAIPAAIAGHDVIGIAQTGTGKTAAYLIPIIKKLSYHKPDKHVRAVVVAPTKELALQITEMSVKLSQFTDLKSYCLIGGKGLKQQLKTLEEKFDIVIATPGRFMEAYLEGGLWLKNVEIFVIDEADRMVDMGFMPQLIRMQEVLPQKRQNLLFSATMPPKVIPIVEEFIEYPMVIEVTPQATTAVTVEQYAYNTPNFRTKLNLLMHLIANSAEEGKYRKTIVFTRTRKWAEQATKYLNRKLEINVKSLHANKDLNTRMNALRLFATDEIPVLITTDVSARGLDIPDVEQVINFDAPLIYEEYVHRIGRTGRAGKSGRSYTFNTEPDQLIMGEIEKVIKRKVEVLSLPPEVEIGETDPQEKNILARELDEIRRKIDPTFKGAFHTKARVYKKPRKLTKPTKLRTTSSRRNKR